MDLILATFAILCIHGAFMPGNVFFPLAKLLWSAPKYIKKPVFQCLFCMTSIYSTPCFFLFASGDHSLLEFLRFAFPLGGILLVLDIILHRINPHYAHS